MLVILNFAFLYQKRQVFSEVLKTQILTNNGGVLSSENDRLVSLKSRISSAILTQYKGNGKAESLAHLKIVTEYFNCVHEGIFKANRLKDVFVDYAAYINETTFQKDTTLQVLKASINETLASLEVHLERQVSLHLKLEEVVYLINMEDDESVKLNLAETLPTQLKIAVSMGKLHQALDANNSLAFLQIVTAIQQDLTKPPIQSSSPFFEIQTLMKELQTLSDLEQSQTFIQKLIPIVSQYYNSWVFAPADDNNQVAKSHEL